MPHQDDIVQNYVERLLKLQSERAESLTSSDLREIAHEVGLSDADLKAAAEIAEKNWQRGLGYLQYGRHDDAIKELEAAAALAPVRIDILYATAQAYRDRYRSLRHPDDRRKAELFVRRCLDIEPQHQPSFQLLNDLDHAYLTVVSKPSPPPVKLRQLLITLAVLIPLASTAMFFLTKPTSQPDRPPLIATHIVEPPTIPATVNPPNVANAVDIPDVPNVPVQFVVPEALSGIEIKARKSRLDYYNDGGFYSLEGELRNQSKLEFEEIKAFLELIDEKGSIVATDSAQIHSNIDARIRPGDVWVFNSLCRIAKPAVKARVTIQDYNATPAATAYAPGKPVLVTWAFERPQDMQVEVLERLRTQSSSSSSTVYFSTEFAIKNTGTRPIQLMRFQMRYLDAAGKQLSTWEFYLTIKTDAVQPVGETWARSTIHEVPQSIARYELMVIEAE